MGFPDGSPSFTGRFSLAAEGLRVQALSKLRACHVCDSCLLWVSLPFPLRAVPLGREVWPAHPKHPITAFCRAVALEIPRSPRLHRRRTKLLLDKRYFPECEARPNGVTLELLANC